MKDGPLTRYRALVASGTLAPDPHQAAAAERLQQLARALFAFQRALRPGLLDHLLGRGRPEPPRGLYIAGAVGRGKTMLMDLFFETVRFEPKRRLHFHEFMAEVHEEIAEARKLREGDPMPEVATRLAARGRLLSVDDVLLTDIADAMILGRLFAGLLAAGVVVVATSNTEPRELYKDGLNRQLFLPFVDAIEERMQLVRLVAARDYRLEKLAGERLYFTPIDAASTAALRRAWRLLTGTERGLPHELTVKGRRLKVPEAEMGVAWFRYSELCGAALGAGDYLVLAHTYHTLILEGIPLLGPEQRNEARRFVALIDTLYDRRRRLIASAAVEPDRLYVRGDNAAMFERTVSRLYEMRSAGYLEASTAAERSPAAGADFGRSGPSAP